MHQAVVTPTSLPRRSQTRPHIPTVRTDRRLDIVDNVGSVKARSLAPLSVYRHSIYEPVLRKAVLYATTI